VGNVLEQVNLRPAGLLVIVHADHFEAPLARIRQVAQVFPGNGKKFMPFVAIHGGLRRLYVVGSAGFDFNEAQHVLVPTDQIDLPATIGRTEIAGDHDVSPPSKLEVNIFLSATAGAQMIGHVFPGQGFGADPVEDAYCGVSEASGEHVARV
jgi:hypothetical protein